MLKHISMELLITICSMHDIVAHVNIPDHVRYDDINGMTKLSMEAAQICHDAALFNTKLSISENVVTMKVLDSF